MSKCIHHWIASEGRTASGVICSKCWDYEGPQPPQKIKIKVLPNPYQNGVTLWKFKNKVREKEGLPPVEFQLTAHYPSHEVVFNRSGFYMTPDDCWLEFDMGDCITKAITYDRERFKYELEEKNQKEKLINLEDWKVIKKLLDRGLISWSEQLRGQATQQSSKSTGIQFSKRFMASKKRIKQAIKEKRNG